MYDIPDVVQLPGKITEAAVVTTAEIDLYDPRAAPEVRRRALAVVMSQNPELFVEIDHKLGGRLMEETLRREAVRETKLLKHQMSAYDIRYRQTDPAIGTGRQTRQHQRR